MADAHQSFLNSYLPYLLRRVDQTLSGPFYGVLTEHGVARSEWRVLAVLYQHGEMSVADLAVAALSPQPTVTHALTRLEKRKLIARTKGEIDKRQRFIAITPEGIDLAAELIAQAKQLETKALEGIGDLAPLINELQSLTAHIEHRLPELSLNHSNPTS